MSQIYKYIAVFFFATTFVLGIMYNYANLKVNRLESEKTALKMEVKSCNDGVKEFNDAQIRAGDTIQKVREVVRTVKSDCDCYNIAVDKRILDRVRKR
jgi:hypothetical protein